MNRRSLLILLTVVLSCVVHAVAAQPARDRRQHTSAVRVSIDNFGRVNEDYYRGSQPKGRAYEELASLGIKRIICLTSFDEHTDEPAMAAAAGLQFTQLPMTTHLVPPPDMVVKFLKIVNDPANQPVFVHCIGGRHRTGVMSAIYRMTHDGWTGEEAFLEMKRYKYGPDHEHPQFKTFVLGFLANPEYNAVREFMKPMAQP